MKTKVEMEYNGTTMHIEEDVFGLMDEAVDWFDEL